MSERFLYSVYPKQPIKNVINGIPLLRVSKTLNLTKEEVKGCLKCGTVQRRFANENKVERVTLSNLDRLHNAKFIAEEKYADFKLSQIADNRGTVIGGTVNAPVETTETEVKEEVEETSTVTETPVETTETEAKEEVEKTSEAATEEPEVKVEEKQNNYNKGKNKKH